MIKYRVYIKKAMEEINCGWELGNIDNNNGQDKPNSTNSYIRTANYISIDDDCTLHLLIPNWSFNSVYLYFYNSNKEYITFKTKYNVNKIDLKTTDPNAKYVRIIAYRLTINSSTIVYAHNHINIIVVHKKNKPVLLHDSSIPEKEYHLINANLHLEDSTAGSLEFVLTKHHPYYTQKLNFLTDTLYVTRTYKDGSERIIWDGRPISEEVDTEGNILYHCEGALSYLNDIRIPKNPYGVRYLSIAQLFDEYILSGLNSISDDGVADRYFHTIQTKDGQNEYIEFNRIYIKNSNTYAIDMNSDSGLKLLNDIRDSFKAHFKVQYDKNSSVYDDTIHRCLTGVDEFEGLIPIKRIYIVANTYPVSSRNVNSELIDNAAKIKTDELFYIGYDDSSLLNIQLFKSLVSFTCTRQSTSANFNDADHYKYYIRKINDIDPNLYEMRYSEEFEMDAEGNLVNRLYIKTLANTIPHLKAEFGLNIFSAKKTTEIENIATSIIPRGLQFEGSNGQETNVFLNSSSIIKDNVDGQGNVTKKVTNFEQTEKPPEEAVDFAGSYLFDYDLIKKYGIIEAVVDFEEADTPKKLYYQGRVWFKELKRNIVRRNVEISLYDLTRAITYNPDIEDTNELLADPEYIDIWTHIDASIPELDITEADPETYYVSALDIPLDNWIDTQVSLVNTAELISQAKIDAGYILGSSKGIIDTSMTSS